MKEIKIKDKVYLEEFDIEVNPYLTYSQIQQIVKAMKAQEDWATRQQNMDLLILFHATNLTKEQIEEVGHDVLLQSGLIDAVYEQIVNIDDINKALAYTESLQRALAQIAKELPKTMEPIMKKVKGRGVSGKE